MKQSRVMAQPTKDRLLDVAERLFAEHGFGTTSMRTITNEAGANLAAVNYHFGSKDGLAQAIFARRLGPLNGERLRRLKDLQRRHGRAVPLNELVQALLCPALELSRDEAGGGALFIRLLGRSHTELSAGLQGSVRDMHQELMERYEPAFAAALPGLGRDELAWRMHLLMGALAYCMSGSNLMRLPALDLSEASDYEQLVQRLAAFLSAGMQAPPVDASLESGLRLAPVHAHPSS